MKQNLFKLLSNIKLYSSYYFAIVSVLGIVWGAFALYDNWRDDNAILQSNVKTIIQAQVTAARTDSLLLSQQKIIQEQLKGLQGTTESLENSYVKYISTDKKLTKEDFLKYMDGLSFDVKKNSSTVTMGLKTRPPLLTVIE